MRSRPSSSGVLRLPAEHLAGRARCWRTSRRRPSGARGIVKLAGSLDAVELARDLGELADRRLAAGADVERVAVVVLAQLARGRDERVADVVAVDEVARDVRVDERRQLAAHAVLDDLRHQPRGILERAVDGVEAQVRRGQAVLLAVVVDEVRAGGLGDRVVAVDGAGSRAPRARRRSRRTPTSCRRGCRPRCCASRAARAARACSSGSCAGSARRRSRTSTRRRRCS